VLLSRSALSLYFSSPNTFIAFPSTTAIVITECVYEICLTRRCFRDSDDLRFRRLAFSTSGFRSLALQIEPPGDIRFVIQIAHDNFPAIADILGDCLAYDSNNDVAFIPNATSAESRAFRNIATLSRGF